MAVQKITQTDIKKLSEEFKMPISRIYAIMEVESSGIGFAKDTGKIIIQFEPSWFKRKSPYTPSGKWSLNKVDVQVNEWIAFNDAFYKNPNTAMESTSIGIMQVMGFHYKLLGFKTVGSMWDYAKVSEYNQMRLGLLFIKSNLKMYNAFVNGEWKVAAKFYNGEKYYIHKYDLKLENADKKYHHLN
jgi:hypothetical protein